MLKVYARLKSSPAEVFNFVSNNENFDEYFKEKYDIEYIDDELPPGLGKITKFIGGTNNISISFSTEITEFNPNKAISWFTYYEEMKQNGKIIETKMPELIMRVSINETDYGTDLCVSYNLSGKYNFFEKIYYWFCNISERKELKRYVNYIQNKI